MIGVEEGKSTVMVCIHLAHGIGCKLKCLQGASELMLGNQQGVVERVANRRYISREGQSKVCGEARGLASQCPLTHVRSKKPVAM